MKKKMPIIKPKASAPITIGKLFVISGYSFLTKVNAFSFRKPTKPMNYNQGWLKYG